MDKPRIRCIQETEQRKADYRVIYYNPVTSLDEAVHSEWLQGVCNFLNQEKALNVAYAKNAMYGMLGTWTSLESNV